MSQHYELWVIPSVKVYRNVESVYKERALLHLKPSQSVSVDFGIGPQM